MSTISDPTQSHPATEARLEELAQEWTFLADKRQPIDERMEQIKAEYRQLLKQGTSVKAAGVTISVRRNATFDADAFRKAYPVMQNTQLYKSVPDHGAINKNLPPVEVQRFQKEGTPAVVIK
jgi:predicted Zn-dependent protease